MWMFMCLLSLLVVKAYSFSALCTQHLAPRHTWEIFFKDATYFMFFHLELKKFTASLRYDWDMIKCPYFKSVQCIGLCPSTYGI